MPIPGRTGNGAPPAGTSGRTPAASGSRSNVNVDRAKLGLGSARPSEMVEGLEKLAERVEKQEQRDEERRKSGGKMSLNKALLVDDTGRRWARQVLIGMSALLVLLALGAAAMYTLANWKSIDPRKGNAETSEMLRELVIYAQQLTFEKGESPSADAVRQKLQEKIDERLKKIEAELAADQRRRETEKARIRPPDASLIRDRDALTRLREFKDPWGEPFKFSMNDLELTVTAKGSPKAEAVEPVVIKLATTGGQ